jgi:hypothetical protein
MITVEFHTLPWYWFPTVRRIHRDYNQVDMYSIQRVVLARCPADAQGDDFRFGVHISLTV